MAPIGAVAASQDPSGAPSTPPGPSLGAPQTATQQDTSRQAAKRQLGTAVDDFNAFILSRADNSLLLEWRAVQAAILRLVTSDANSAENRLSSIESSLKTLQKPPAQSPSPPPSYAAALRSGLPQLRVREVPTRLNREIIITNTSSAPQDRGRPVSEIVQAINSGKSQEIEGQVLAARRLPSGDILITTDTERTKEGLEKSKGWLTAIGQAAKVNRRKFTVLAHSMRLSAIDCTNQEEAIRQIMGCNRHLQGRVEILRVQWPRRAIKQNKAVSHLIVDVATPEQANILIDEGLLFQAELKECELYHGDCRLTQCYNCQKYGHLAKFCRSTTKCGYCAAIGHDDHHCSLRNAPDKARCANCSLMHPAWSSHCQVRRAQVEKAKFAYATRPRRFACRTSVNQTAAQALRNVRPLTQPGQRTQPGPENEDVRILSTIERMEDVQVGTSCRPSLKRKLPHIPTPPLAQTIQRRGPGRPRTLPPPEPADDDQSIEGYFSTQEQHE